MKKSQSGFLHPAIVVLLVVVLGASGFAAWRVSTNSQTNTNPDINARPASSKQTVPSYEAAIDKFITAMQKKDKATVDSLFTSNAKNKIRGMSQSGTSSFYDACQSYGQACTAYFDTATVSKYKKSVKDYAAPDGTKGKEVTFITGQSLEGQPGPDCKSESANTLTVSVIPASDTWLIDDFNQESNASANLCPAQ